MNRLDDMVRFLLIFLTSMMLAGCSGSETPEPSGENTDPPAEETVDSEEESVPPAPE